MYVYMHTYVCTCIYVYVSYHVLFNIGNIIEWSYPEDIQLDGIEFRAMASGFHTVNSDFM